MEELDPSDHVISNAVKESWRDILYTVLGGPLEGRDEYQEENLRLITLNYVHTVYTRISKIKKGVG